LNFSCVATICGISWTQVVQLVAQKLIRTTLPFSWSVLERVPSSRVYPTLRYRLIRADALKDQVASDEECGGNNQGGERASGFHRRTSMQRRNFTSGLISVAAFAASGSASRTAQAQAVTESEAASGIRAALERGASAAVQLLGRTDGFLGNPKVRIPLPGFLNDASKLLKLTGQQRRVDELITAMNRAAEQAVPRQGPLLVNAVRSMSVEDGRRILTGGDDSATRFFADKTRTPLTARFLPIIAKATDPRRAGRQVQCAGRQGSRCRPDERQGRQPPAVRHRQGARRAVPDDRRGGAEDPQ
jgi:hypothetical protein